MFSMLHVEKDWGDWGRGFRDEYVSQRVHHGRFHCNNYFSLQPHNLQILQLQSMIQMKLHFSVSKTVD